MTMFSAVLYYQDHKIIGKKTSAVNWLWRIIIHMFLLAPLIRYHRIYDKYWFHSKITHKLELIEYLFLWGVILPRSRDNPLSLTIFCRLIETLKFGLKSRQDEGWRENRKNYKYMLDEDVDLTLIRLFENFLEDAPQLTLQLYIMSTHGTENDFLLSKFI